jgi:CspA family cold shock protein
LLVFGGISAYVQGATAFHSLNAKLYSPSASGAWPGQPPFKQMFTSAPPRHVPGESIGVTMTIGTVKFFNSGKGFGFVAPEGGGKDVFVHASAVEAAGMSVLSEGQRISFDTLADVKGAKAVNLKAV